MKKILFCLMLTGCFTKPMTSEQVEQAIAYCKNQNMEAEARTNGLNPGYPTGVRCVDMKNKLYYDVPRK